MQRAFSLRPMLVVAAVGACACARVAAPVPPTMPLATDLNGEHVVADGLPDFALTAASETPGPATRAGEAEWAPFPSLLLTDQYPASRLFDALNPTANCGLTIEAGLEPTLVAMDSLPNVPTTDLALDADPGCAPSLP